MDREQYEKLKQAEKEHLRKMKEIKAKLREVERQKKLLKAVQGVKPPSELEDTYDEMMERLQNETIEGEVKLEMAMDATSETPVRPTPEMEEELEKARARLLVEQMKLEMGGVTSERSAPKGTTEKETSESGSSEKTIGRQTDRSAGSEEAEDETPGEPEKTIGRRRKK